MIGDGGNMKTVILFVTVITLVHSKTLTWVIHPDAQRKFLIDNESSDTGGERCINMWDEGCVNGQLDGSGKDDFYLGGGGGGFNPGKRCVNMWDDGCVNGQLNGAGNDDFYLGSGFNPGKRSLRLNTYLRKNFPLSQYNRPT